MTEAKLKLEFSRLPRFEFDFSRNVCFHFLTFIELPAAQNSQSLICDYIIIIIIYASDGSPLVTVAVECRV